MKTIKPILIFICLFAGCAINAKENLLDSYNLNRAYEEGAKGNYIQAIEYFNKELKEHPNNSWAYLGLAALNYDRNEYDEAYTAIEEAIKRASKKDKDIMAKAYYFKGNILLTATDTVGALNYFEKSLAFDPGYGDVYELRGQLYFEQKNYDLSDKDYSKLIELKPAYEAGYLGLGRNAFQRKNYEEAEKYYSKVINMFPEFSRAYSMRAETYIVRKEYLKAIEDIKKALAIDSDYKAFLLLFDFPEEQEALVIAKLKGLTVENPNTGEFLYYAGQVYANNKHYEKSNELLEKAIEIDMQPEILSVISENYVKMGDYQKALEYKDREINISKEDEEVLAEKGEILYELGDYEGAIALLTEYIEKTPDFFGGYYMRGWYKNLSMKTDEAIEDYEMAINLNPEFAYAHFGLAEMLMRKGETEKAMKEYETVLTLDTVPTDNSCAMYAFLALGRKGEAIDFLNKVIELDPSDSGKYYDAACVYGKTGDKQKAIENLKTALELGFRRFAHIDNDDDMDPIRNLPEFHELMNIYRSKESDNIMNNDKTENEKIETDNYVVITEIPFTPEAGCASVKCTINDLPLSLIFDTGASIVSISQLEANFMLKNGYLKPSDFVGSGKFVNANGEVSENAIINLRNISFGDLHLDNVKASVVKNQKAPLLLGQTVLGRLGSIEIDNNNKKLIIKNNR